MNFYELIMKRRSVRNFNDQPIPVELVEKLLDAANNAPSGGNIQPLSIILVQESENKEKLAEIVGNQPWVKNAPLSMVFCLDYNCVKRWAVMSGTEFKGDQAFSHFLISYADVICAAQSVVLLAESLGLGSVYVGTIQSCMDQARQLLDIPEYVLPIMVLSLGYPKSIPHTIPKLKREVIVHHEQYQVRSDEEILQAFDQKYGDFSIKAEEYLEKAFIETIEADKQGADGWTEWAVSAMTKLEIRNNAEFLFKLRYPNDVMVKMNKHLIESFKNAGFDFFLEQNS
ncbi:MAG: nitroreductase family protein [Anaerolineaceae bacterium]|nr:nitroreductase family protein [Anaerolineaceae bacterium]